MARTLKFHNVFGNCQSLHVRSSFFKKGKDGREIFLAVSLPQRVIPLKLYDYDSLSPFAGSCHVFLVKAQLTRVNAKRVKASHQEKSCETRSRRNSLKRKREKTSETIFLVV